MRESRPERSFIQLGHDARRVSGVLLVTATLGAAATLLLIPAADWLETPVAWAAAPATTSTNAPAVPAKTMTGTTTAPANAVKTAGGSTTAPANTVKTASGVTTAPANAVKTANGATTAPAISAKAAAPAPARSPALPAPTATVPQGPQTAPARVASARPGTTTLRAAATPVLAGTTVRAANSPLRPHLEDRIAYQYNALGRRDPFQSLIDGGFVGHDVGGDVPPDIGGIKVVGIVWGTSDRFALVEDPTGSSLVLRPGDKVMNGVVSGLRRDALLVSITTDGQTESVAIPLTRKGDSNGNR